MKCFYPFHLKIHFKQQLLADDTGAFHTLDELLLQKNINDHQREHHKDDTCIHVELQDVGVIDPVYISDGTSQSGDPLGKQHRIADVEELRIEGIVVLPNQREDRYRDGRRGSIPEHDPEVGMPYAAAVHISRLLDLLRQAPEELVENVDIQSRPEAAGEEGHDVHGPHRTQQVRAVAHDETKDTEDIEVRKGHVQRKHDGMGRDNDH